MSNTSETGIKFRSHIAIVVASAALAMPGAALAESPTADQYGDALTKITVGANSSHHADPTGETGGSLPFTGLDIAAMAAIAAGLGLGGLAIRRRLAGSEPGPTP